MSLATSSRRLRSGYSRIPVHVAGRPFAFLGLLLVKKVRKLTLNPGFISHLCPQLSIYDPSQALPVSKFPLSILPEADPTINCFQALDYL